MAGRHSSHARERGRRRVVPLVLLLLAAVGLGMGAFVLVGDVTDAAAGCHGSVRVRVAAAPEIAPVLDRATARLESSGTSVNGMCIDYVVAATAPEKVADGLSSDPAGAPDLWVPDFSVWVTRVAQDGATPATLARSLARSPVVVVGRHLAQPASWQQVGMNTVAYLDPLTSSASTAALLSAFGEMKVTGASMTQMGAMMVPLAQRYGAQPHKPQTVQDVAEAAEKGAQGVMTEQQLVSLQQAGKAKDLTATLPRSGTMELDYPMAALSADRTTREAGQKLAGYLASSAGRALLAGHGFRNAKGTPLRSGKGLGSRQVDVLPAPDAQQVTGALRRWSVLTVPSRILAVVDVSGSMDFTDGGQSRISLAIKAAEGALQLFPDNGQVGLWAFSIGLGGGDRDYTSLVPVRPLTSGQRNDLDRALARLPQMTNGGTGLFDTTLAAIRTMQADYDPRAVNNVVLLTDGANQDSDTLSMDELVRDIQRERDPARPVRVIAIGMGPQADATALRRIAAATGGRSYVARNPSDISKVFIDAMLSR